MVREFGEGRPNYGFHKAPNSEEQRQPLDLGHGKTVGLEPLLYHVLGFWRLGGITFNCRNCEVSRPKVLGEHVAHPSSGDRMVDRWTLITREGVNTMLNSHSSGSHNKGSQRFNNSTREVSSCEKH
jgi:hypothetical protein